MTTQTEPTKLKWHKPEPKHPGVWEAQYKKAYADNSYDNVTATITIEKDDDGWFFSSSEEWNSWELNGILGYKTLKECKQKALEAVEVDIWTSEAAEAESDPDYIQLKNEAIAMKKEESDRWAA